MKFNVICVLHLQSTFPLVTRLKGLLCELAPTDGCIHGCGRVPFAPFVSGNVSLVLLLSLLPFRTFSEDTVFGEKDSVSLDYTLEKEALKKTTRNEGGWSLVSVKSTSTSTNSSNNVHVGAVCSLQDSPYRIFKVSHWARCREECSVHLHLIPPFCQALSLSLSL